jgi:zinc protease
VEPFQLVDNITADDVREWISSRYIPAQACVILAGDIEPGHAMRRVEHHFGALASKSAPARKADEVTNAAAASRRQVNISVTQGRLYIAWIGPSFVSAEYSVVEAAAQILASGNGSRLWRRIAVNERLASEITVEVRPRALGSLLTIQVTAQNGIPLSTIEAGVREEIGCLSTEVPVTEEMNSARLRLFGKMVRGFEHAGGPQSKSDALGQAMLVAGTSDLHRRHLSRLAAMEPDDVSTVVRRWLTSKSAVLQMLPAA